MTGTRSDRSNLLVHSFPADLPLARRVARDLGVRCAQVRTHRFPDGESLVRVRIPSPARAILIRSLENPDPKLFETLLAADAMRRAGAKAVSLVAPYLPYMRQDKVFAPGQPVSQRVLGGILGRAFDEVITLDPHLHRVAKLTDVIPCRARALSAAPAIGDWIRRHAPDAIVVGPDEESGRWIREIASSANVASVVGSKRRMGDRTVRIHFDSFAPARHAVVVDDIASSGATMAAAIGALRERGVAVIDTIVVHAIFAPGARALIRRAGARRILSCDTIPHPTNAIGCARLIAAAIGQSR